jgi:hypothetical protein
MFGAKHSIEIHLQTELIITQLYNCVQNVSISCMVSTYSIQKAIFLLHNTTKTEIHSFNSVTRAACVIVDDVLLLFVSSGSNYTITRNYVITCDIQDTFRSNKTILMKHIFLEKWY